MRLTLHLGNREVFRFSKPRHLAHLRLDGKGLLVLFLSAFSCIQAVANLYGRLNGLPINTTQGSPYYCIHTTTRYRNGWGCLVRTGGLEVGNFYAENTLMGLDGLGISCIQVIETLLLEFF